MQLFHQSVETIPATSIEFESLTDKWGFQGIGFLGFSSTCIPITKGCWERIKPLLKPAVNTLARFLLQVPNEIRSNDGLNISRQSATAGIQIETFVRKKDF